MATTTDTKPLTCVARRHIKPAAFKTYDAMLATAKAGQEARVREGKPAGDPIYSGTLADLGNKNNRSKEQEGEGINELEADGWIIPLQERRGDRKEQRRNKRAGTWATFQYRIVEHDEYAQAHDCPPPKYDAKGNLIKPGILALGLRRANVRRWLAAFGIILADDPLGNHMADMVADAKATDTGNPVAAGIAPTQEILYPPTQGILLRTETGNPVTTATGNPVTRFASPQASISQAPSASHGQVGQAPERVGKSSSPSATKAMVVEEESRWLQFINDPAHHLPDSLRYAQPKPDEREAVLAQLDDIGSIEYLVMAIEEWEEQQSPPLDTLRFGRWKRWLETGGAIFEGWKTYARKRKG